MVGVDYLAREKRYGTEPDAVQVSIPGGVGKSSRNRT